MTSKNERTAAIEAALRSSTPPPKPVPDTVQLTPEKVRRIELNRLKAKARRKEWLEKTKAEPSTTPNPNNKRPLEVTSALSLSPTAPHKRSYENDKKGEKTTEGLKPLERNSRLSNYYEYNLSKMVNSKGGFLIDENSGKEIDEDTLRREKQRENERTAKNVEPLRFLDPRLNPKCRECGTMDIDHVFRTTFKCDVCKTCKNTFPEKYSLLTKTECKLDYLLTDPELRDEEVMPHLLRPNPHSSTWNNMMLFLRYQVEEFAWKKWGSPEKLDDEFFRREGLKKQKRGKKFEEGLKDLRRKTREGIWQKRQDEQHHHTFGTIEMGDDDDVGIQRCSECGFTIEVEEF